MKVFGMVSTKSSEEYTDFALRSFFQYTHLEGDDRFLLIDNNGTYRIPDAPWAKKIEIIRNPAPKGFAANANRGVDYALSRKADLYFLNNDIIFSEGWITPLLVERRAIISPSSNREFQYSSNIFDASVVMSLEYYRGKEAAFQTVAEIHRGRVHGYYNVMALPFFCVKIPFVILEAIGHFDESYGLGGGEDYDYCLRAVLENFQVSYALSSYVLHFGGKSSWSGVESALEQQTRESHFFKVFQEKWGEDLFQSVLRENQSIITSRPDLLKQTEAGNHRDVVKHLLNKREIATKI